MDCQQYLSNDKQYKKISKYISLSLHEKFIAGVLPPDAKADFRLLDRVVNVCSSHCVPFGIKGTIVGIRYSAFLTLYFTFGNHDLIEFNSNF